MCNCAKRGLTVNKIFDTILNMIIHEYNENWKSQFVEIKDILEKNLSKTIGIEHVGSTAITGMLAKPIIDIDIIIESNEQFNKTKEELELLGYYHNGDQGIRGREVFKRVNGKQDNVLDKIKHHLYVCEKDNLELKQHLLFRDYLNKHDKKKSAYNKIKKSSLK